MTHQVAGTGNARTLQRIDSDAAFNAAINDALTSRGSAGGSRGGGRASASQGREPSNPLQTDSGPDGGGNGGGAPVTAPTQALIDSALLFDQNGDPNSPDSAQNWARVQAAIADEVRLGVLPPDPAETDPLAEIKLTPELTAKLPTLKAWAQETDPLGQAAKQAIDQVDLEIRTSRRDKALDDMRSGVDDSLGEARRKNDDEHLFRRGWDGMTGGGAGEDLVEFLEGRSDRLKDLDTRDETLTDEQFAQELKTIMGDFGVQFQKHIEQVAESDETWATVGEVGRVVVSAAAGIITTAATGGNFGLGFAAAFGTYEVIDLAHDGYAKFVQHKDPYADGHSGFFTGVFDAAGLDGDIGMEAADAKSWAKDLTMDTISSVGTAGATKLGMGAASWAGGKLGAGAWGSAIANSGTATRVLATGAGGFTGQTVNSAAFISSDAARMGFDGEFSWDQLGESARSQLVYMGTSIPTSLVAGWIPLFKTLPQGAAATGQNAAANAGTAAGNNFAYRLNYAGLAGQFANDTVSNFGSAYLVDGDISQADTISALGGVIPGTLQNVAVRPDTAARVDAWRQGNRDLKLPPPGIDLPALKARLRPWLDANWKERLALWKDVAPPPSLNLPAITATVLGLRGVLLGVDAATGAPTSKTANDVAVPLSALRSGLSKFAWFRGNHRLVRVYDLALAGDRKALEMFQSTEANRGRHGVKVKDDPNAKPGEPSPEYRDIEALLALGEAYATARARLPEEQQHLMPTLSVRKLTEPDPVMARLMGDDAIPAELQPILQAFRPDARLLQYSNVVEGLLTDPEFVINGIDAVGVKLAPADIEGLRQIFNAQKRLELDAARGGYNSQQHGTSWRDAKWWTTQQGARTIPGIYDTETGRLTTETDLFVQTHGTNSHTSHRLLENTLGAWNAYLALYSQTRPDVPGGRPLADIAAARTDYLDAVSLLPAELQARMPVGRLVSESPQDVLTRLRSEEALPEDVREALSVFRPDTHLLENPGTVQALQADPDLLSHTVDGLRGKLKDHQFDSIKVIMDIHQLLKADTTQGGFDNRQQGVTWNELGWRAATDEHGQTTKLGIFDEETARLDRFVDDFIQNAPRDQNGAEPAGLRPLLDAWKTYLALYSQTQHDLAKAEYKAGIDRIPAEQKLGSSASPDTKYGYMLKAGAYGVAVNLVYSWAMKATPATEGGLNNVLKVAYGGEMGLALYNLVGQIGYMRALGNMTRFKAQYDKYQYIPSDIEAHTKIFDAGLHKQFKSLETKRAFWNAFSDYGSLISFGRNAAMTAAYATMGFPLLAAMSGTNAALSAGWFGVQRTSLQTRLPARVANAIRWGSIFGGTALQWGVFAMALAEADKLAKARGEEGSSAADLLEGWLTQVVDAIADEDAADSVHGPALPDRA